MTFDDGILTVYNVENASPPGAMPIKNLIEKAQYYYSYDRLGITRYYTALEANQNVEAVVNIQGWNDIKNTDVVIMQELPDIQYRVALVQPEIDENGLRIMKLTLERVSRLYAIPATSTASIINSNE